MDEGYEAVGVRKEKDVDQTGSEPEEECNGFGYRVFSYIRTVRIRKSFDVPILPTIELPRTNELPNHRCGLPPPLTYIAAMAGSKPLLHVAAILFPESNSS